MTRTTRTMRLSLIVVLVGFLFVPKLLTNRANGQTGCSAASLSGPYGIQGSGTLFGAPGAFVATLVFDGQGNLADTPLLLSVGGTIDPVDAKGTYTVKSDCNGKIVIFTAHHNPPRSHYHDIDMVVVDGGREAFFMVGGPKDSPSGSAPPGEVLSGVMKRL